MARIPEKCFSWVFLCEACAGARRISTLGKNLFFIEEGRVRLSERVARKCCIWFS
jgi:hypothetical protein